VRNLMMRLGVRGTLVLALAIMVAGVVGIARLVGGAAPRREPPIDGGATAAVATVDPTAGNDGVLTSPKPPADDPAVRAAADTFMKAWLKSDRSATAWHDGVAGLITESLADRLAGVDPGSVPAARTTGAAEIVTKQANFAQVDVPVDTGTVSLRLRQSEGRWLVDGIDWARE
jgi:hypothetical protein